jgi:hypothetical protein
MRYFEIWTKLRVPGDYTTINNAISSAVSGQTIFVSGSNTLTGNVTIPSGVTLKLLSGSTVNFNGYYIDAINGTFDIQNGANIYVTNGSSTYFGLFASVQSAIDFASNGQVVALLAGSYTESLTFTGRSNISLSGQGQGSTFINGGIAVTNSTDISISDLCTRSWVVLNNSSRCHIACATSGSTLASIYGCTNSFVSGATANNIGASFGISIYDGTGNINSSSLSTGDCAIYLTHNASYDIGLSNTFCDNGYDVDAQGGAYAYCISNIYSRPVPSSLQGNYTWSGSANGTCGQQYKGGRANGGVQLSATASTQTPPPGTVQLRDLDDKYLALMRAIHDAKEANKYDPQNYSQDYQTLLNGYKGLIAAANDKAVIIAALSKTHHLYVEISNQKGFVAFATQLLEGGQLVTLEPYLRRYTMWDDVNNGHCDNALRAADEVVASKDAGDDLKAEMLYEKGLIYKYYLGDTTKAYEMYTAIASTYPSNPLVRYAAADRGIHPAIKSKNAASPTGPASASPGDLKVYPNPFNPTTTVEFSITRSGFVSIRVYDMLGRVVAVLVNEEMASGLHSVLFNASKLPSGVYICRLEAAGKSVIQEMLLLK